jgi:hypothetical protein
MYHLLVFVGLIGVAIVAAKSPVAIRLFEYLFPIADRDRPTVNSANSRSIEQSEVRDEIRRLTAVLETQQRGARKD